MVGIIAGEIDGWLRPSCMYDDLRNGRQIIVLGVGERCRGKEFLFYWKLAVYSGSMSRFPGEIRSHSFRILSLQKQAQFWIRATLTIGV
jgi:hypothetical protein